MEHRERIRPDQGLDLGGLDLIRGLSELAAKQPELFRNVQTRNGRTSDPATTNDDIDDADIDAIVNALKARNYDHPNLVLAVQRWARECRHIDAECREKLRSSIPPAAE